MSYYTASRLGDLPDIIQLIDASPMPGAMLDRFIAGTADAVLRELLQDWKADVVAAEASGQGSEADSLAKIADAVQGIEDRPTASVSCLSDRDGVTIRLQEGIVIGE